MIRLTRIALFVLLSAASAFAQNSSALINEALDKIVNLDLNTTFPEAIKSIEDKTGVPIRAGKDVYESLPWGEQTNITAKVENKPLREALAAMTSKLGMIYVVTDETVEIRPMPALVRLGRRSTIDELQSIDYLKNHKLKNDAATVAELATAIDKQLQEDKSPFSVENRAGDTLGQAKLKTFRDKSLLDQLEEMSAQSRATWYPWGKSIVIVPREDQIRMMLGRPITVRYAGVDVSQVLTELARRSGVEFSIEPGAVQKIPPEARTIKLVLENVSLKQALESICSFTGLGYVANENGVYIWNQTASAAPRRDRIVGLIPMEGGMQVVLPENELPDDVRQFLEAKRKKAIEDLRQQMKKENFIPTTQPTTKPAEDL